MFTGIIEEVGVIEREAPGPGGGRQLTISTQFDPATIAIGDSIAVGGVCLTVVRREAGRFAIDAGPETLARTTIGRLQTGSRVNLERALTLDKRLGGHLVQGHVDAVGTVLSVTQRENAFDLEISAPSEVLSLTAPRGAISVDGISLTVTAVGATSFGVSIIPHTWTVTTLAERAAGAPVNLEADLIARYVARLLAPAASKIDEEFLKRHGFA
jgi:riboflavin synthase